MRLIYFLLLEQRGVALARISPRIETASQLLAEIISALPKPPKLAGLEYMEQTIAGPESRSLQALMELLDEGYGKTDSERHWPWLNQFSDFARCPDENLGDFGRDFEQRA